MQEIKHGLFFTRDETPIYFEVRGQGKPLVFCNGLLCKIEHWRHQIEHFSKKYQVITFEYRGHQRSALPPNGENLTVEWCSRDLNDLIQHLKLQKVCALGHSMGVATILLANRERAGNFAGNVLICGAVANPFQKMFFLPALDLWIQRVTRWVEWSPFSLNRAWKSATKPNALLEFLTGQLGFNAEQSSVADVRSYLEGVHETPMRVFHQLVQDYRVLDGRDWLDEVQTPSLVLAGARDVVTPLETQEEMADLLPNGELVRIEKGSHNAHVDFPEQVNSTIEAFFQKIGYL